MDISLNRWCLLCSCRPPGRRRTEKRKGLDGGLTIRPDHQSLPDMFSRNMSPKITSNLLTPYARHEHERETDVGRGVSNRNGSAFGIQHTFSPPNPHFLFLGVGGLRRNAGSWRPLLTIRNELWFDGQLAPPGRRRPATDRHHSLVGGSLSFCF